MIVYQHFKLYATVNKKGKIIFHIEESNGKEHSINEIPHDLYEFLKSKLIKWRKQPKNKTLRCIRFTYGYDLEKGIHAVAVYYYKDIEYIEERGETIVGGRIYRMITRGYEYYKNRFTGLLPAWIYQKN